jgi:hypothetical protein
MNRICTLIIPSQQETGPGVSEGSREALFSFLLSLFITASSPEEKRDPVNYPLPGSG